MKTAIGLMSGTSMDGLDLALVRTDGRQVVEFGASHAVEYSPDLRKAIQAGLEDARKIIDRRDRPGSLAGLERRITDLHVDTVGDFLKQNRLQASDIDVLGFHGQTVLHRPEQALTVQLGLADRLAKASGIDVVADLRAADMEAGGQGAPLVPVFHRALAEKMAAEMPVCFVNIGGISNITYVDQVDHDQTTADCGSLIAFDTGPGNALIDQWMETTTGLACDRGGELGLKGRVLAPLVERYLSSDYFLKPGPKSLDRNDFPQLASGQCSVEDGARTLAAVTAQAIVGAVPHLPKNPNLWVICGGGRLNRAIMLELKERLAPFGGQVVSAEEAGLAGDMLEAQAFGYLAVRSLNGLPLTFPATTGCKKPVTGGVLERADKPDLET